MGLYVFGKRALTDKIGMTEERKISMEDVLQLEMLKLMLKYLRIFIWQVLESTIYVIKARKEIDWVSWRGNEGQEAELQVKSDLVDAAQ